MVRANFLLLNIVAGSIFIAGLIAGCAASNPQPSAITPAEAVAPDPQVREALVNSCYGCHSAQPPDPWYAHLAPSRWASGSARDALDFSQWQSYGADKRQRERGLIASVVDAGTMPPGDYTFFDGSAKLSDEQKQEISKWASQDGSPTPAH